MDFKHIYTSTRTYIVLLIIGICMLLFTTGMAYRQIMLTQKSADLVVQTLQVYNVLAGLTNHYSKAESEEFRNELINKKLNPLIFESYKAEGRNIIDSLRILTQGNELQILRIKPLANLIDTLHEQLVSLDKIQGQDIETIQALESQKVQIANTLRQIRNIKSRMFEDEERFMKSRKAKYALHKSLTPTMLLGTAFIALFIFTISVIKIYAHKVKIKKSASFLNSVLANTDNIVNYYEPVVHENEIIDFKIIYANNCNKDYLDLEPTAILGETVIGMYPFHKTYEDIKELMVSYYEQSKVVFDRQILVEGKKMWFHAIATPLGEGVLVTTRNSTPEEEAKEIEFAFKKQLEHQNLELIENRAFLTNIFKSIVHVVMHFKSVRGEDGSIIDFEILFINERESAFNVAPVEAIKQKRISEIYPNIFKSEVFTQLKKAVETNQPGRYEMPYYAGDSLRWYRYTAIKLGDGVTVTIRDITEEKEKSDEITQLNEELVIQNSILTDAERIGKSGSFYWYMDKKNAEISDNFYRMLGYEPGDFEPSFERYREFIHPDDLNVYDTQGERAMRKFYIEENTYRVITKEGNIKYFKTDGQFISKNDKKVMIGVVQDVTQSIEAEARLIKSNLELKNSNSELESFNRVASHDLQEPLRKIQLFSLRIEELDGASLSEKSKEYFQKVITAVKRMQSLIENLLTYSRIDSSQTDYEGIDLNQTVIKIQEDLYTSITDSNAEIISDDLPFINGVVFQMEQLFTNLVANAIKYRNPNESPKIQIRYKQVKAKDISEQFNTTVQLYHEISFIDNGIGFDAQYTDKIFEVFQRLHQKNEYSGTGIGLAICKKIVENHSGFIHAQGTLGVGSKFTVYLPVTALS